MMTGISGKNTRPEMVIRRLLHASGFRYRLHRKDLPGAPDIVLPKYHVAIFAHGCFWHVHSGCYLFRMPASNIEFWHKKLTGNRARDERQIEQLRLLGWRALVVWECATRDTSKCADLQQRLADWIHGHMDFGEIPAKATAIRRTRISKTKA